MVEESSRTWADLGRMSDVCRRSYAPRGSLGWGRCLIVIWTKMKITSCKATKIPKLRLWTLRWLLLIKFPGPQQETKSLRFWIVLKPFTSVQPLTEKNLRARCIFLQDKFIWKLKDFQRFNSDFVLPKLTFSFIDNRRRFTESLTQSPDRATITQKVREGSQIPPQ